MGNIRTKNPLLSILEKWDREDPKGSEYRSYNDTPNNLIIHRLESEYYLECNSSTVGPMDKQQLIAISHNKPNIQLNNTIQEIVLNPQGDVLQPSLTATDDINSELLEKPTNQTEKTFEKENIIEKCSDFQKNERKLNYIIMKTNEYIRKTRNDRKKFLNTKNRFFIDPKKALMIHDIFRENVMLTEEKKVTNSKSNIQTKNSTFNLSFLKKSEINRKKPVYNLNDINSRDLKASSVNNSKSQCGTAEINEEISPLSVKKNALGFSEPIKNETARYTAYAKFDTLDWSKQKSLIRRLSLGFEQRFGCNVQLGNEPIQFRGNIYYTVNISGKDEASVLKCRNCLPTQLLSILIQPQENSEESATLVNKKLSNYSPYNPKISYNFGANAKKLSY